MPKPRKHADASDQNARSFCNSVCDIFAERTKEIREADIAITTEATTKNTS
jgi:hypothetical protein